jgi:hypothetical protein
MTMFFIVTLLNNFGLWTSYFELSVVIHLLTRYDSVTDFPSWVQPNGPLTWKVMEWTNPRNMDTQKVIQDQYIVLIHVAKT